jgi:hypothetical protein
VRVCEERFAAFALSFSYFHIENLEAETREYTSKFILDVITRIAPAAAESLHEVKQTAFKKVGLWTDI